MTREFKGLSVWISSSGTTLEEYNTELDDQNSIRCFISSVAGEQFQINWEDHTENPASLVACYMDGRPMGGMPSYPNASGCYDGVRVSERTVKPFYFSSVVVTGLSMRFSFVIL